MFKPLPKQLYKFYDQDALIYHNDTLFFYGQKVDPKLIDDLKNHRFQIYSGYYEPKVFSQNEAKKEKNKPTIYLIGRGETSGKKIIKIVNFYPYCYVYNPNGDYETYLGERVEKIVFHCNPKAVGYLRKNIEENGGRVPLEADIPFIRRFLCDVRNVFKPNDLIQPKVGIIDIETNYPKNDNIISFAINDGENIYYNDKFITKSYKELILDLWNRAKKFDIITNWNVNFDIEKLDKAYRKITGKYDSIKRYCGIFDLAKHTVKKLYGKEIRGGWSLKNAGLHIAQTLKVDITGQPNELDHDELLRYNCVDVIDDICLLYTYHEAGKVLPSKPPYSLKPKDKEEAQYKAADPRARPGVYHNILKFDVKQCYPTALLAINASPETKCKDGKFIAPNGIRFNDKKSVFINALNQLLDQKAKVKRLRDEAYQKYGKSHPISKKYKYIYFAIKTQAAAFSHGEFGYWRSRTKDYEVAEAITSTAKDFIFYIMEKCDELNYRWIYSHTDSVFINARPENKADIETLLNYYSWEFSKLRGYSITFQLEYDGYYPIGYIHSAARNVLVRIEYQT